jgi:DNA-binding response OmpR family regulator
LSLRGGKNRKFLPELGHFMNFGPDSALGTLPDTQGRRMKNILVIDDNDQIRSLIKAILTAHGFNVLEAGRGQIGMLMMRDQHPDLVICDVNMPGMDGYETLGAMRDSSATAQIPFILMTGLVSRDGFRRGMVCGADDYLAKPFTAGELVEAIISRLSRQADIQMAADKRAQQLHDYAARYSFPEFTGIPHSLPSEVAV